MGDSVQDRLHRTLNSVTPDLSSFIREVVPLLTIMAFTFAGLIWFVDVMIDAAENKILRGAKASSNEFFAEQMKWRDQRMAELSSRQESLRSDLIRTLESRVTSIETRIGFMSTQIVEAKDMAARCFGAESSARKKRRKRLRQADLYPYFRATSQ